MRLVAWNCCGKFADNLDHLLGLDFDVAVVCECGPVPLPRESRPLTSLMQPAYPGTPKHLGVLAREPWEARPRTDLVDMPWLLPADVIGPVPFTLLAVWPVSMKGWPSYTGQVREVAEQGLPHLTGPVVLAGDLNAPITTTLPAHLDNVERLADYGLASAFLTSRGQSAAEAHGDAAEASLIGRRTAAAVREPTFYQHRRRDRSFHIDHIFIPLSWVASTALEVGDFDTWISSGRSDHVPVIADIEFPPEGMHQAAWRTDH